MPADSAATRYARAAFEIAVASGDIAGWSTAIARIGSFLTQPEHARLLENSRVAVETKHRLVDAGLNDLPPLAGNLAHLLVNKGRTALAGGVAEHFTSLVEGHEGIARARVTTAVPLSDSDRNALGARLRQATGRRVQLEAAVDPSIVGGVVVQIGDRLFDGSTRSRLAALRENLVGAVG